MELIENMAANDHAILRDRAYPPTKKSLLELTSQVALLAQNNLLAKQLETLTETVSKLHQQLQAVQPAHSSVMHIRGCNICGGAHESGMCMVQDDVSKEVNYMTNPYHQGFHQGRPPGYNQGGISLKAKVGDPTPGITSAEIKEFHLIGLPIKGLIYMTKPLS